MLVFHSPDQIGHDPVHYFRRGQFIPHPERGERYRALRDAALGSGFDVRLAPAAGLEPILAVHDSDYVDYLKEAWRLWTEAGLADQPLVPNHFAGRQMHRRPSHVTGLAGYYMLDTTCPMGPESFAAACGSADAAVAATKAVLAGAGHAFALCRPPGHHAFKAGCSGFCFFNNAGIAAELLRQQHANVAILDIDVHHGNGTQHIFYERPDIFFASLHGDPAGYFPYYAGYADEIGEGAGRGFNLNIPLPPGTGDTSFLEGLDHALERIGQARPGALVLSLGLDLAANDPLGIFEISTSGLEAIATRIARLGLPTVIVQEGGYLNEYLGRNLVTFLVAFQKVRAGT